MCELEHWSSGLHAVIGIKWNDLALPKAQETINALLIATGFGGMAWLFINLKTLDLYTWGILSSAGSSEC